MSNTSKLGLTLEIGYNWVPHFDPRQGGSALNRITALRHEVSEQHGKAVGLVCIKGNEELNGDEFQFFGDGHLIEKGQLPADYLLLPDSGCFEHEFYPGAGYPCFFEPLLNRRLIMIRKGAETDLLSWGLPIIEPVEILLKYVRRALEIEMLFGDTAVSLIES
jgi:flagellar biosynthesis component FlhA